MSTISLIIVEVLPSPVPCPAEESFQANRLLRLGNAWLQRRATGARDSLVLLGVGPADEESYRSALMPFGLGAAEIAIIDDIDEGAGLGEEVGGYLDGRFARQHRSAIPLASWPAPYRNFGYPDDVWWLGIECAEEVPANWSESVSSAAPTPFDKQAATWVAILGTVTDLEPDGTVTNAIESALAAASLARWLNGFSAASGDQFFDFDYGDAAKAFGLDPFLLGFEAARHHLEELEGEFEGADVDDAQRIAAKALLCSDRYLDTRAIRQFFGGSAPLFFSLYSSIWPKRTLRAGEACENLAGLNDVDLGEIDEAWRFAAHDDWSDIDDSD